MNAIDFFSFHFTAKLPIVFSFLLYYISIARKFTILELDQKKIWAKLFQPNLPFLEHKDSISQGGPKL